MNPPSFVTVLKKGAFRQGYFQATQDFKKLNLTPSLLNKVLELENKQRQVK